MPTNEHEPTTRRTPAQAAADAVGISARVLARRIRAGDLAVSEQVNAIKVLLDRVVSEAREERIAGIRVRHPVAVDPSDDSLDAAPERLPWVPPTLTPVDPFETILSVGATFTYAGVGYGVVRDVNGRVLYRELGGEPRTDHLVVEVLGPTDTGIRVRVVR